jgi:hypothetical protein
MLLDEADRLKSSIMADSARVLGRVVRIYVTDFGGQGGLASLG